MLPPAPAVTRRRLLLGATAIPLTLSVAACTEDAPVELPVDPDRAALQSARETELALRSVVTAWTPARLDDQAAALLVVDAHVEALDAALGGDPTPTGSTPAPETVSTADVRRAVDAAADAHSRALREIGSLVTPLVAAIAASDAALGASLRGERL